MEVLCYDEGAMIGDRFYPLHTEIDEKGWMILKNRINGVYNLGINKSNKHMFDKPEMRYILSSQHPVTDELIKNFPDAYNKPGSLFIIKTANADMLCVLVEEQDGDISLINIISGLRVGLIGVDIYHIYLRIVQEYGHIHIVFMCNLNKGNLIFSKVNTNNDKVKIELHIEFDRSYQCINDIADNDSIIIKDPNGVTMSIPYDDMISLRKQIDSIMKNYN
jgi:hypothetical protein